MEVPRRHFSRFFAHASLQCETSPGGVSHWKNQYETHVGHPPRDAKNKQKSAKIDPTVSSLLPALGHDVLRRAGVDLGGVWASPGRSWATVGRSWGALGRSWGALGRVLGASLVLLGASWAALGRSWAALGRSWPLWAALGRSWGALGRLLGCSWPLLGRSESVKNRQKIDPKIDPRKKHQKNGLEDHFFKGPARGP